LPTNPTIINHKQTHSMITFNVITLFPELFEPFLDTLPISRAIENNLVNINLVQLRDFAIDDRGTVDGRTYGGGVGMVLRVEPVWQAVESVYRAPVEQVREDAGSSVIALSPSGQKYTQEKALDLAQLETITLICGRYEGLDERIKQHVATDVISIGDYVLSGGEIPALTVMESVIRLLPGVLEKEQASMEDSFMPELDRKKEFPQYTRPEIYKGKKVPEILLSGDHEKIKKWRENRTKATS
jgi:tRNA (guanine37-N1)-methyltransferase